MELRHFDVTVISAEDLKNVNFFTKMSVYAVVWISGDASSRQKTQVHKSSGRNPIWNERLRFTINESAAKQNPNIVIQFKLKSARSLGDRDIGDVYVSVKELLDQAGDQEMTFHYTVRRANGQLKGRLTFSCQFGEKFEAEAASNFVAEAVLPPDTTAYKGMNGQQEPVMAYPPPQFYNHAAAAGSNSGYPPPPSQPGIGYPYHPPPPPPGYTGYQLQGTGGYYQYPPPPQPQPQTAVVPEKSKRGGMGMGLGMGLGAGLLGGLLLGGVADGITDNHDYDYDDCDYDF